MTMDTSVKENNSGNDYFVYTNLKIVVDVCNDVVNVVFIDTRICEVINMDNEITIITFANIIQCGQEVIGTPIVKHGEVIGCIVEVNKDFITCEFDVKNIYPVFNDTTKQICCFVME